MTTVSQFMPKAFEALARRVNSIPIVVDVSEEERTGLLEDLSLVANSIGADMDHFGSDWRQVLESVEGLKSLIWTIRALGFEDEGPGRLRICGYSVAALRQVRQYRQEIVDADERWLDEERDPRSVRVWREDLDATRAELALIDGVLARALDATVTA